jgi:hypothetical protein
MDLDQLEKHSDNKYLYGVLFMIYIIAGKYITEQPAENIRQFAEHPIFKYVIVYAAAFIATKSIRQAGILSIVYAVVFDILLEPKSKLSILKMPAKENKEMVPEQRRIIPDNSNDIINNVAKQMQQESRDMEPQPYY